MHKVPGVTVSQCIGSRYANLMVHFGDPLDLIILLFYRLHDLLRLFSILPSTVMLLVNIDYLLHFVVAAHENSRPVVYVFWNDGDHSVHAAVNSLTTSCQSTSASAM